MINRVFAVLTAIMIFPSFAYANAISTTDHDRCIKAAVTDSSSLENLTVDFSLVPSDCGRAIQAYGYATGLNEVAIALISVTRQAIESGAVPQLEQGNQIIMVADIDMAGYAERRESN